MNAIVRSEYGSPDVLELREVAKPVPSDGEVLVRVHASSVNMADVDYLLGRPRIARLGTGLRRPKNSGLGLDVAGEVEAVGKNATLFHTGDEVGLGKAVVEAVRKHPCLDDTKRLLLATADGRSLYQRFGFQPLHHPDHWMEFNGTTV